jgi:hypothetical protein
VPFHLKASVSSGAGIQGEIEEYWISPVKWRRTIRTPAFSQTTILNGESFYEKNEGDYFPSALRVIADALLQPIPRKLQEALSQSRVNLVFYPGLARVNYCDSNQVKTGTPPAVGEFLISVCFAGTPPTISSIVMPGYSVEFKDRLPFGKLLVARNLSSGSSPATKWEAHVVELTTIQAPDESLFMTSETTPASQRFRLFQVSEQEARQVFKNLPPIVWPEVRQGKTSGVVTLYVSLDKNGKPREVWPLNSDNPEISAAACEQIQEWNFGDGHPTGKFVQFETVFTFAFVTQKAAIEPDGAPGVRR